MNAVARVDESACAAHGDCLVEAPQAFALNGDDVAEVIGNAPLDDLTRAAEACPSVAISIFDQDTGEQLYP
jgi:ferredoxin